jgi:hypothetical protein
MSHPVKPRMRTGYVTQIAGKDHEARVGEQLDEARPVRLAGCSDDKPVGGETAATSHGEASAVRSGLGT